MTPKFPTKNFRENLPSKVSAEIMVTHLAWIFDCFLAKMGFYISVQKFRTEKFLTEIFVKKILTISFPRKISSKEIPVLE